MDRSSDRRWFVEQKESRCEAFAGGRSRSALDFDGLFDLHLVKLVDDLIEFLVEFVDEFGGSFRSDGTLTGRFDEVLLFEDAEGIPNFVMGVAGLVRHLDDPDRFAFDDHSQDLQVAFEHIHFLFESVYHVIC